jgi:hypothetical protein
VQVYEQDPFGRLESLGYGVVTIPPSSGTPNTAVFNTVDGDITHLHLQAHTKFHVQFGGQWDPLLKNCQPSFLEVILS